MDLQQIKIKRMIQHYREKGHHFVQLDPLELNRNHQQFPSIDEFGLFENDNPSGFKDNLYILEDKDQTIRQLADRLHKVYVAKIGLELNHYLDSNPNNQQLYDQYEKKILEFDINQQQKKEILRKLIETEQLDLFLQKKFQTFKRYGGQGSESLMVMMDRIFEISREKGYEDIVMAMNHRGRLNMLVNLLEYPLKDLLLKIMGRSDMNSSILGGSDDVISHLGCSNDLNGLKVSLMHNPSHLEAINSVSQGKTRAKIDDKIKSGHKVGSDKKVLNIQLHGDSAFNGQGIVYESLLLNKLKDYKTDGTLHIITNNQIGYTTDTDCCRVNKYATTMANGFGVPIIHLNGNDVEGCLSVLDFCFEFIQQHGQDIIIDLNCYRLYGHNEVDEPGFTQPLMYQSIRSQKYNVVRQWEQKMIDQGLIQQDEIEQIKQEVAQQYDQVYQQARQEYQQYNIVGFNDQSYKGNRSMTHKWKGMVLSGYGQQEPQQTGFDVQQLKQMLIQSVDVSQDMQIHKRLLQFFIEDRKKQVEKESIDWAGSETIAVMSLLKEGFNVRISGQDVERGTFSQRHWLLTDQKTEQKYNMIQSYLDKEQIQARFQCFNSPLSEYSVLCYEWGYGLESPQNLNIWEAQFGDFFNGGQIFFDTFFSSSESKWMRQNGMTVLLPHGFDGMGPEHSSSKIERFLLQTNTNGVYQDYQLVEQIGVDKVFDLQQNQFQCDYESINFNIVQPTSPANYFHVLRRQMHRNYRKPLLVVSPKVLLRHPQCRSQLSELGVGTMFQPILTIYGQNLGSKKNLILCSGKIRYQIQQTIEKKKKQDENVVVVVEELAPFPEIILQDLFEQLDRNVGVYWVQEEPLNQGAFQYCQVHLNRIISNSQINTNVKYIGRKSISCVAQGNKMMYDKEQQQLLNIITNII